VAQAVSREPGDLLDTVVHSSAGVRRASGSSRVTTGRVVLARERDPLALRFAQELSIMSCVPLGRAARLRRHFRSKTRPRAGAASTVSAQAISKSAEPKRAASKRAISTTAGAAQIDPVLATDPLAHPGSGLSVARALYPEAPEPWLDLSTAINPTPYPAPRASSRARARLPEPQDLQKLEATAANAFGVDDASRVLATGGSECVVRLLPHVLPSVTEAVIVWPTYASHIDSWQHAGAPISRIYSIERASPAPGAVVTVVNPNNPDGAITGREQLLAAHDQIATYDGFLLVDEAFADMDPSCSVAALAGSERYPRLIVLRSFGKFYGLAGVRLGFMIGAPSLIARFRAVLGDWPVSADAIAAGLAAYADPKWAEQTRVRLRATARRLDALLMRSGFSIVGGTSLFRLASCDDARARLDRLLRAGILARPFNHDTKLLRFGLPPGTAGWRRLQAALNARP
jgi:cobalamin biosynthetic protein CobC